VSESVADQTAEFAIELEDKTSGAAASAAQALGKLKSQIEGDTRALGAMQKAMKNLQGGTVVNVQQFKALQQQIEAKKASIASAQGKFLSLGGTFAQTGTKASAFEARLAALSKQASIMPGPLGGLLSKFQGLSAAVGGGAMALGILAVVAALALLVAGTAAAVTALTQYGIVQADARRSELLRLEGLTKLRNYWGIAAGNANEMQSSIDKVAASSALGRDKIAQYSDELYRMGLRGNNLEAALEGVAIKASAQGDAQAHAFGQWAAGAALTGRSVRALSDDVKARLGGVAAKQMLSLTVQAEKQKEAFAALFSDLKIEPLLKAKKEINDLFGQSTASGRALKQLLTLLVQPLIDGLTAAAPIAKRFFQGLILGAQSIVIGILLVRASIRKTFGSSETKSSIDYMGLALKAGKVAAYVFGVGLSIAAVAVVGLATKLIALLIPAIWSLVTATAAFVVEGLIIAAPFLLATAAVWGMIKIVRLLYVVWKEIDWSDLGRSIWQGLVNGLNSGARWVVEAVSSLGEAASNAFKKALGISSPAKVFVEHGNQIPAGIQVGVTKGTPAARAAVRGMLQSPELNASAAANDPTAFSPVIEPASGPSSSAPDSKGQGKGARGGGTVTITTLNVHVASDKPRDIALDIKRELETILEGVAIQLGAPVGGAA
jgi:hypothetical protein